MYQFVHVNAYAQKVSTKTKERKEGDDKPRSVQDIVNEALRVEGYYSPLITNPKPPIHLYGTPVEQMPEIVADWAKQTKDPKGRKTRADAKGLLAGVFSVKEGTPPEVWEQVKADGIAWAKLKYGERLKCVIEHIDEEHPHCHFFVVPLPGEEFESVHEGIAAKKAALSEGLPTKQANVEYRNAMKGFCDGYYEEVGAPNGMLRLGPGRRRLPRAAYFAEIQQAEAIKDQFRKAIEVKQNSEIEAEMKILGAEATLELAKSEAKIIKEDANSGADAIIVAAKDEAREIKEKSKQSAGKYISAAKKHGYKKGIEVAEEEMKGTWLFTKINVYIERIQKKLGIAEKERDELKSEVEDLRSFKDRFFDAMIEITSLKSRLGKAEEKAEFAEKQKDRADALSEKVKHLRDQVKVERARREKVESDLQVAMKKLEPEKRAPANGRLSGYEI